MGKQITTKTYTVIITHIQLSLFLCLALILKQDGLEIICLEKGQEKARLDAGGKISRCTISGRGE